MTPHKNPDGPSTYLPGGGGGGGGKLPPIVDKQPNPNLPWKNGGGTTGGGKNGPHKGGRGYFGVYVGFDGDGYRPCHWLRRNFARTGRVYWLHRYRLCVRRHFD